MNDRIGPSDIDRPVSSPDLGKFWGSDAIATVLRALDIPFVALVPGSSYRGLHDSIVNFLGNRDPQIVVCLHEEHAVAVADGYARATDKPLFVALHANVGLMHGSMPIFSAWCNRVPMIVLGATGPVDANKRRPWIDWIHTARDQGALIRDFIKWDDQPASVSAAIEALLRARQIAMTPPFGPTYVCFDVTTQEEPLDTLPDIPDVARFAPASPPEASRDDIAAVAQALSASQRPLFLYGRGGRSPDAWNVRVRLAEATGAAVMTSLHNAAVFPTGHRQHLLPPCPERPSQAEASLIGNADLIVSFDWLDFAGYLRGITGRSQTHSPIGVPIVHCSLDALVHKGWSMDHQALPAADISILADPDRFAVQLFDALDPAPPLSGWNFSAPHWTTVEAPDESGTDSQEISLTDLAHAVRDLAERQTVTIARLPLGWPHDTCVFNDSLSYLGKDGGAAVGVGPGNAVGTALALCDSDRVVMAVLGDGDLIMGATALWTASHLGLPLLIVVANNRSYFNDERHQERVARTRRRPVENRWIGQRLTEPEIDIVAMARAQGFDAGDPIRTRAALDDALAEGVAKVAAGGRVLIDVRIKPGYADD
jgi:benzoylformate decarboxylase